jgi:hypothetical protein
MTPEYMKILNDLDVKILKDRLSFQPDEITAGTIVLDGETVQWELAKPGPQARNNDTGFGDWTTYFEKDEQVIHPDQSTHRYLLRYACQLSVTEAVDIYNAIVWALQEKVHPDHCHCQSCET